MRPTTNPSGYPPATGTQLFRANSAGDGSPRTGSPRTGNPRTGNPRTGNPRSGGRFLAAALGGWALSAAACGWLIAAEADKPAAPAVAPYDTEQDMSVPRMEAAESAAKFRVPEGFKVSVFAAEPDVLNPIACTWDRRGRLWVAENFTYAERGKKFALDLSDRVVIFSDRDGDGKFDERKVFLADAKRLTSVEVGRGGVWLMCPPQLLFVPDRNGDDVPDGPAEVVLDGFDVPAENHHNFANGLRWGVDGWLWGRCGASSPGNLRRPDADPATAVPMAGTMWRYHPVTKAVEAVSHGTTNPWGHDTDKHGETFFINTVNGHFWHVIPGAHYRRPHTISPNPLVYAPIEMHADHWHWDTGKDWTDSRKVTGKHDELGGGHAHIGAMIYRADQWPQQYRDRLFTINMHGRRANVERIERHGTGFIARHEPDILFAADPWFRGMELTYGPDGSVYILDWSDTGECHDHTGVHRNSGRIYRVTSGTPAPQAAPDLTKLDLTQLANLHDHSNEWFVRQARLELVDRHARGEDVAAARLKLAEKFEGERDPVAALRRLFTLYQLGWTDRDRLLRLFGHESEFVRNQAVKLLCDHWPLDNARGECLAEQVSVEGLIFERWLDLARTDESGLVRLALASSLQRLPVERRPALAEALLSHSEDAADANQPFMVWYGTIPVALKTPEKLVAAAAQGKFPQYRRWAARRFAEVAAKHPAALDRLLAAAANAPAAIKADFVQGIADGLEGQRKLPVPAGFAAFEKDLEAQLSPEIRGKLQAIRVVFGDGRALDEVRKLALDGKADLQQRRAALLTLIEAQPADLRPICESLLKVRFLNTAALQGLTRFDDPAIGVQLVKNWKSFHPTERPAVIEALVSRASFVPALLEEVAAGRIARGDLSAAQARQIRSFDKEPLTRRLTEVWGELKDSPKDKQELIDKLKTQLTAAALEAADKSAGRAIFAKSCTNCHRLFGTGGEVGPDLTGANRKNLDYLLSNIVDPSAVVTKDFQITVFHLTDGRVVQGIVTSETGPTVTVQTAVDRQVLAKDDIDERQQSTLSLMPEGLLQPLAPEQIRDLTAYLMSSGQVPLPAGSAPATGP